jgi:hypothetical protein
MKYLSYYLIAAFLLPAFLYAQDKHSFIGAEACGVCHKTEKQGSQLSIWKNSAHSKAFDVLKTAEADAIAKKKGFETAAVKTEACLKCHVSGYNTDASLLGKKFKMEDGVQCETCHGAGSDYKDMKIMKNRELAVKNGMKVFDKIEDLCVKCHNEESPTYKPLDVAAAWDKIKHDVPVKK